MIVARWNNVSFKYPKYPSFYRQSRKHFPDGSFYQNPKDAPKRINAAKEKSRISPRTGIAYIRDAGFSAREEIGRPAICVDSRARSAKGGDGSKGVREGGVVTRELAGGGGPGARAVA